MVFRNEVMLAFPTPSSPSCTHEAGVRNVSIFFAHSSLWKVSLFKGAF